jgi:hypothetical protein
MNLSWFASAPFSTADNLIDNNTLIESVYSSGTPGTEELRFWVVNNGNELPNTIVGELVKFGFYIDSDYPEEKNKILDLANLQNDDNECPYGLYILFGWQGNDPMSFDKVEESADLELLAKFKVSWTNGNSVINPILLSEAYTYNGTAYVQRQNLQLNEGSLDSNNEGKGSLCVLARLVVPPAESEYGSFLSNIRINATCIKEI